MAKERIGILGGVFDPIHQGHIRMAQCALDSVHLDQMLILPSGNPPYKACSTDQEDRWKMVVMACSRDSRLQPSRLELDREGDIYTIDTLVALKKEHPKAELFYLIGADALMKLHQWHEIEHVLPLVTFLVCPRVYSADPLAFSEEKARLESVGARISILRMPPVDVSSTSVRQTLASGGIAPLLDVFNREYCGAKGLYGMPRRIEEADFWLNGLFRDLNPHRFAHSLSVAYTARRLARIHGINPLQAEQAGLLHDCAKCFPLKEMRRIAVEHSLTDDPAILDSGALLHSLVGAWVARNTYGMADPEVLEAIAYHNTGNAGMSRLAMCVCLADSIEPTRESYPLLENVRILAELSLERALLMSLEGTADYVRSRGKYLHPRTQQTIAWLKTLPAVRPGKNTSASKPRS